MHVKCVGTGVRGGESFGCRAAARYLPEFSGRPKYLVYDPVQASE